MLAASLMLHQLDEGLWVSARSERRFGLRFPVHTTIVRGHDSRLLVYCPGPLDAELRAAVDGLGTVGELCVPNLLQGDQVASWSAAYPTAVVLTAPGFAAQQPHLTVTGELGVESLRHWDQQLRVLLCAGIERVNEVVVLHRPSRSLLISELAYHLPPGVSLIARAVGRLNLSGKAFGPPRTLRWLIDDAGALQRSIDQLSTWDFDRVVVQVGPVVASGGRQALRRAFRGIGRPGPWWQ